MGKPIIALPSTAKRGEQSRIVPFLMPGAGVVTGRADAHNVVTEHGVTNSYGRNLRERAEALIGIAHPGFRQELERTAKERRWRLEVEPTRGVRTGDGRPPAGP
jgi:acyl-CoA hydrolase